MSQGRPATSRELDRIAHLLANTDMNISEIAERVGRSRSVVLSINRRLNIRIYIGKTQWKLSRKLSLSQNSRGEVEETYARYEDGGNPGK